MTFINRMKQTIWVAASPDASHPMARTGWVLRPGHRVTVIVPNRWNGRFWGRTGCVFHGGRGHCQTGDCAGRLQCQGWGTIPATLAEYDLDAWDNLDFYDVSMVDGSNLPMYIYPTTGHATKKVSVHGCVAAGLHLVRALPERPQDQLSRQVRRVRVGVRQARRRPVLLPRQVGAAGEVQPAQVAGGLRPGVQAG